MTNQGFKGWFVTLLRRLFGEEQMRALADYIQASLMLNYNKREVG